MFNLLTESTLRQTTVLSPEVQAVLQLLDALRSPLAQPLFCIEGMAPCALSFTPTTTVAELVQAVEEVDALWRSDETSAVEPLRLLSEALTARLEALGLALDQALAWAQWLEFCGRPLTLVEVSVLDCLSEYLTLEVGQTLPQNFQRWAAPLAELAIELLAHYIAPPVLLDAVSARAAALPLEEALHLERLVTRSYAHWRSTGDTEVLRPVAALYPALAQTIWRSVA